MPRKPRILSSTGIYHIVLRSVNQHIIFEEASDYQHFLFILSDCKQKYDIDIYAYCLMNNHIHLMLFSPPEQLSSFFQSLGTRFVRWYNIKYSRSGHLFQDRFFSSIVENDRAFLATLSYIHNNPVKGNLCRYPSEYRWSSVNAYYGEKNPLINVSFAYDIAGSKDSLLKFFSSCSGADKSAPHIELPADNPHFVNDEKALQIFKKVTNLASASDVSLLNRRERNHYISILRKYGLTVKQVARIMDISPSTVKRICQAEPVFQES